MLKGRIFGPDLFFWHQFRQGQRIRGFKDSSEKSAKEQKSKRAKVRSAEVQKGFEDSRIQGFKWKNNRV